MIYIANDHGGVVLKNKIVKFLKKKGYNVENLGTDSFDSVNYADFAKKLCPKVLENPTNFGILICKSGIGMSIVANRFKGIRAGLSLNSNMAKLCRNHNNCNVLVLGSRTCNYKKVVLTFLTESFAGGRHLDRVNSIDEN